MKIDYLIIGAGLAGSTCAHLLAKKGVDVLLVDNADLLTKDKLCAGMLTPRSAKMVCKLYGNAALSSITQQTFNNMRVLFANHDRVLPCPTVYATQRKDLDQLALYAALNSNATVLDNAKVKEIDFATRQAIISGNNMLFTVTFGALIAADGVGSAVRRLVVKQMQSEGAGELLPRYSQPTKAHISPTLEAYVSPTNSQLIGRYESAFSGYCWYVPCGEYGNIGCGGSTVQSAKQLRDALHAFAMEIGVELDNSAIRGACLPCGDTVLLQTQLGNCPLFFVGDAAGLAVPASGEGIYYALYSAMQLAKSLCDSSAPSYYFLMSLAARTLSIQHAVLPLVFNEELMEKLVKVSHSSGLNPVRAARGVLKLFAGF